MPLSNCSLIVFKELWFSLQTYVLIVAMQETEYGLHQIVLSYNKSVKETRRKKYVNTSRLRLVIYNLFLSTRSLTLTYAVWWP